MGYATDIFSKRLREIREAAGLTQEQLAKALKVSRGAISYYEKGERTPDIEFIDSLTQYFGVPVEFALGYTANIKLKHKNMFEIYGLTDKACEKLEDDENLGHLISVLLEHNKFSDVRGTLDFILKYHASLEASEIHYLSYLISNVLYKIIFDGFTDLKWAAFTQEELNALKSEWDKEDETYQNSLERYKEQEKRIHESSEKYFEKYKQSKEYQARMAVREKFLESVDDLTEDLP